MASPTISLTTFSLDIGNDEQAAVLYSPFRGKNANPTSWTSKMSFWQRALEQAAFEKRLVTFDLNTLPQLFLRKGLTPKCLPTVVEELQRLGKVKSIGDYQKRNSWISWGFSVLVKEPLSWGVSQVLGSPKKTSSIFVWPEVLKKVSEEVLSLLQSSVRQGIISHVISFPKLEDLCIHILASKEHFDLVINYLQMNKKIYLEQTEQHGVLVKVCEENKASVTQLKATDTNIFEINEARLKIEKEISTISNGTDALKAEAKDYMKSSNKRMAIHCLRKKKRIEKIILSKFSTLHNLEDILYKIEEAKTNGMVVQACEKGLAVLKEMSSENSVDRVESVMNEVNEAVQDVEDVTATIHSIGSNSNEDALDLEEELMTLLSDSERPVERKELSSSDDLMLPDLAGLSLSGSDLPEVPTHSPSSKSFSPSKEANYFLSS